jgi:hypothetical protein
LLLSDFHRSFGLGRCSGGERPAFREKAKNGLHEASKLPPWACLQPLQDVSEWECESIALIPHSTECLRRPGLMAGDREVASRVGTRLSVLINRERDAGEAALIAALTEKREPVVDIELACPRGKLLVRLAEDVLCSHR